MIALFRRFLMAALLLSAASGSALEVSLTVEGDIEEIQAVLEYLKSIESDRSEGEEDALKINVHSIAGDAEETEADETEAAPVAVEPLEIPLALSRPQVLPAKGAPGAPFIITVQVMDKYNEVDTLSARLGETSLSTDLYDDGTHGDVTPGDGLWTATMTPLDVTPSGTYPVVITGYNKNGQVLNTLDAAGAVIKLTTATELTIER